VNTYSVFLRPAGRTVVIFRLYDSADYLNAMGCTATLTGSGSVGSNANIGTGTTISSSISEAGNGWYRVTCTGTVSGVASNVRPRISLVAGSTTYTGDGVSGVDIWALQAEQGPFASTPILPPVGAPAASTRGTDILTAPLPALGIADSGACTVLWRGVFNATNFGDSQTIVGIDNGADNRCDLRVSLAGIPTVIRVTGGALATSAFGITAVTPGATVRAGMTIDGAGRVAAFYDGFASGAVQAVTGGPTSGLTTFRHGTSQGARPLWGETHTLTVLPRVLSDTDLQAAVAAL
jgi:hypothetical protein